MKIFIKAAVLIAVLLVTAKASKAQVSVGIMIGAPPPPRSVAQDQWHLSEQFF
jgi:hypothetical protein